MQGIGDFERDATMGRTGQYQGRDRRRIGFAGLLTAVAMLVAAPVAADDTSLLGDDVDAPRTAEDTRTVDWTNLLTEPEGVEWTVLVDDPADVEIDVDAGVTADGTEWTETSVVDPSGIEWTETLAVEADGSTELEVTTTDPAGIEWTITTTTHVDGSAITRSTFIDTDGQVWVRKSRGKDLGGVEWTKSAR